jgi:hypothetical protein
LWETDSLNSVIRCQVRLFVVNLKKQNSQKPGFLKKPGFSRGVLV